MRVVPGLDEVDHGHLSLRLAPEPLPLPKLALERGKEALAQRVVVRIAYRTCRGPNALVTVLVGGLDLFETSYILSRADLVVSNDSGLMHLAAELETPLAAILGPMSIRKNRPISPRSVVVSKALPCSPCNPQVPCHYDRARLKNITVEDVMRAVNSLIPLPKA